MVCHRGETVGERGVVAETRQPQRDNVGAQIPATAVRAGALPAQGRGVVEEEFPDADPLARQGASQRVLVPVEVLNVLGVAPTACQGLRRRGILEVVAAEIRGQHGKVLG